MSRPDEQRWERRDERAADTCRNGVKVCAGPTAFDLSGEFPVPICGGYVAEATGGEYR